MITDKKENTKAKIINAGIKLISTSGYNAVTTSSIAHQAGVSEAIIFKYFKNKEGLLKEVSANAINEIIENVSIIPFKQNIERSKDFKFEDFIKSIIYERFRFLEKNIELLKMLAIEMQYSTKMKSQVKTMLFPKGFEIYESVRNIIKEKTKISDLKASAVCRILLGIIESAVIQKYLLEIDIKQEEINAEADEIVKIITKGLR